MHLSLVFLLLLLSVAFVSSRRIVSARRVVRSIQTTPVTVSDELIQQLQRERKERRILRKKKQRLKELREEIRQLTMHSKQPGGMTIVSGTAGEGKKTRKDGRWKRKLLEKLKGIARRLDRMEREREKKSFKTVRLLTMSSPAVTRTTTTTTAPDVTTTVLRTSITTPTEDTKMRRIQSSIEQARSGENGTACASHADCRPGRCCQRTVISSPMSQSAATCHFFSLPENAHCLDSCQCAHRLLCFHPKDNSTVPFCKRADSLDVKSGRYLNEKSAMFTTKKRKR